MKEDDKDPEQGGVKAAGVHIFLQRRRPVGVSLQCGEVGGYPLNGTGPGGVSGPGDADTNGEVPEVEARQEVGVHLGRLGKIRNVV